MAPAQIPLTLYVGEERDHPFSVIDAAGVLVPVGTGWTAQAQIRARPGDIGAPLHEFSTASTPPTIVLAGTTATLKQRKLDFVSATWRVGHYDLLLTDPNGKPSRIAMGPVLLSPATSRPA